MCMTEIKVENFSRALLRACELMRESEPYLTELDSIIGDGDHGTGMYDGFTELKLLLEQKKFENLYELTRESGIALIKAMGGASGVVFGTLFIGGHEALTDENGRHRVHADCAVMLDFFRRSAQAVSKRGRVSAEDRTMLDALLYAVAAMEKYGGSDVKALFEAGWKGACEGAEATKAMISRKGRSKNFREKVLGYPDPGAVSTSIIFRGLYEGLCEQE